MIKSFKNKETEKIYNGEFSPRLPKEIQKTALRKLILIDNANSVEDLRIPPGNRLEKLKGKTDRQYSIRINDQFRIVFECEGNKFSSVEIEDYH